MEKAIQKAIEGGYIPQNIYDNPDTSFCVYYNGKAYLGTTALVLLDPTFWQCLGKAMGWEGKKQQVIDNGPYSRPRYELGGWEQTGDWKKEWHSLIDHLADGGNVDEFMNNLIK